MHICTGLLPPAGPRTTKPPGDYIPLGGFVLYSNPRLNSRMPCRLQNYFWRSLDHAMPDGPPFFLFLVVVVLLILNGVIAFLRW
jgi:hypothetical protein